MQHQCTGIRESSRSRRPVLAHASLAEHFAAVFADSQIDGVFRAVGSFGTFAARVSRISRISDDRETAAERFVEAVVRWRTKSCVLCGHLDFSFSLFLY